MMRGPWRIRPVDENLVEHLADTLHLSPLIARLLIHRGTTSSREAHDFLCSDLSSLPSPEQMADLTKAVHLIQQTVSRREPILIVGDYDVDGLTGTALLVRVLSNLGASVSWHIPHRVEDGYGLKAQVVQEAARGGVKLLICVDCGTTSFEELRLAKRLGLEAIVVDHHELMEGKPPPAFAFLNPLQPACHYPTKELASVGVAFTLARGLVGVGHGTEIWDHLDLVALGTIADMAPLVGENRILVKRGLHRLSGTLKPGLRALLSQVKLDGETLTSEEVSFTLAPRLNAAGRMGSAEMSLRLLITQDPEEARALTKRMERENKLRRALEREAFQRALSRVEREINFSKERVIVLEDERWHPGVVGIVATRLSRRFHRPAVVIALSGSVGRGSARSIQNFSLTEALEEVKEHLVEFGGHPGAAGLAIARGRIPSFRGAFNRVAFQRIDPKMLIPCLEADGELPLSALTQELMRDLEVLSPFGAGNPWPVFISQDARLPRTPAPPHFDTRGIRFLVEDSGGRSFQALQSRHELWEGWNIRRLKGGQIQLAYSPVICHRSADHSQIELRLRDLDAPRAQF